MNEMLLTFIILVSPLFMVDMVAVAALIVLSITGIVTPQKAVVGFLNSVVIMIAGLFIMGPGIIS